MQKNRSLFTRPEKGGFMMFHRAAALLLTLLFILTLSSRGIASVEWDVLETLKTEKTPVDLAVSQDGRWIFILTKQGTVLVYSADGVRNDEIAVGKNVDGIDIGPSANLLYLTSKKNKTVQLITLEFIHDINVSGSPFQGPADAPVVIAVFSDYQ